MLLVKRLLIFGIIGPIAALAIVYLFGILKLKIDNTVPIQIAYIASIVPALVTAFVDWLVVRFLLLPYRLITAALVGFCASFTIVGPLFSLAGPSGTAMIVSLIVSGVGVVPAALCSWPAPRFDHKTAN